MTNGEWIILIVFGTIGISILAAIVAYMYENKKPPEKLYRGGGIRTGRVEPSLHSLERWAKKLDIDFDPNDPTDPLAALIAAGEYFRLPGCEPGGQHYEETFQRVVHMMEHMVPPDRADFWVQQVYKLYGTKFILEKKDKG